jgi:prepilin-type N-terminal cleavage/methylation domain-containing protein
MSAGGGLRLARAPRVTSPEDAGTAAGFTLIEVVLALTIFALMAAILYGAFALSQSAVEKSQRNAIRSQKRRSVGDLVGSYIHSAYPYRQSPQEAAPFFEGEPNSVTFVSAYSQAMGGRGMAKIQIASDKDTGGGVQLTLQETTPVRFNDDTGTADQTQSLVLEKDIRNFRIDYLNPQSDPDTWEERWDGRERGMLPRALRFSYLDDGGRKISRTYPLMMMVLKP